jgi:hypothetical protein
MTIKPLKCFGTNWVIKPRYIKQYILGLCIQIVKLSSGFEEADGNIVEITEVFIVPVNIKLCRVGPAVRK